ncbi:methyl-accepting chemotaxis protein [Uliginosibacterium sp. TH139]|uniref:methyl-accepting chemotaxis protein n=2 Tax=unclassified Uliginosibacterium TaxID=2621521 RepID=UPI000C7B4FF3|nr:methyl-accepting chemotaxis protein [Uliginosibacterium sp. TH139]PLK49677.1 methyl-accepting chemotaxis protein [Uliginosibacterium sp. TH139]
MTIAKKLILLACCAGFALLIVSLVGIQSSVKQAKAISTINSRSIPGLDLMHTVRSEQQQIALGLFRFTLAQDAAAKESILRDLETLKGSIRKNFDSYEAMVRTEKGRALYEAEKGLLGEYLGMLSTYLERARTSGTDAQMAGPMGSKRAELSKLLDEHLGLGMKTAEAESASALANADRSVVISIMTSIVAVLVVGWMSYSVIQGINISLTDIQRTMTRIEGDLDFTSRANVRGADEIARVSQGLNRLVDKLAQSFRSIAEQTHRIGQASGQMNLSAEQGALAARKQSDAASSMAAGIEEMTVSINHVGDRAGEARDLSREAGQVAREGIDVINETVNDINSIAQYVNHVASSITELEAHGNKISSIVLVIREVADQTNLLALNAAIEAARAGEQGRGFAVVADEVRKLAERTAGSTAEISSMVESIRMLSQDAAKRMKEAVAMVDNGVLRAGVACDAINRIHASSRGVLDMSEEISSAIREQGSTSNNIAGHVERIAQMAEESSETAQGSARIANELDQLARTMQGVVARYKV